MERSLRQLTTRCSGQHLRLSQALPLAIRLMVLVQVNVKSVIMVLRPSACKRQAFARLGVAAELGRSAAQMKTLTRRKFLAGFITIGSGFALHSCSRDRKKEAQVYSSTLDDIKPKLDNMLNSVRKKVPDIEKHFFPGLSKTEIVEMTNQLPFAFPPELIELYTWRNGTRNIWMDTAEPLFLFRDHSFLPLDKAIEERDPIVRYYGVTNVFPFASHQGSYLVLPSESFSYDKRFERPVVSIFQGIDLFFFSFSIMLDTIIEWFERGVHTPYKFESIDEKLENEVWNKHNPGWVDVKLQ